MDDAMLGYFVPEHGIESFLLNLRYSTQDTANAG